MEIKELQKLDVQMLNRMFWESGLPEEEGEYLCLVNVRGGRHELGKVIATEFGRSGMKYEVITPSKWKKGNEVVAYCIGGANVYEL